MVSHDADSVSERPFEVLGIDGSEEGVYLWLLDNPGATLDRLGKALALSSRVAQRLLAGLESKGLVTRSRQSPRRYRAAPPDIAMEALALQRQEELQRVRGAIRQLQEQTAPADNGQDHLVELLTSRHAERQAFEHLQSTAKFEVQTLVRLPMLISRLDVDPDIDEQTQRDAQSRGVRYRSIVDSDYLAYPGAVRRVRAEMLAGEDVRVVSRLPLKMVVVDRRVAFIPLGVDRAQSPSLLVRSPALVNALHVLFEMLWSGAAPIALRGDIDADASMASVDLSQVLSLMVLLAAGMDDKTIIRELNISASTLHRRMGEMMASMGARTRFQLGWSAALRFSSQEDGTSQPGCDSHPAGA